MEDSRKDRIMVTVYDNYSWVYEECKILCEGFLYSWGKETDNYIEIMTDKGELKRVLQGHTQFYIDSVFKPLPVGRVKLEGLRVVCNKGDNPPLYGIFVKFKGDGVVILSDSGELHCFVYQGVRFLLPEKKVSIKKR